MHKSTHQGAQAWGCVDVVVPSNITLILVKSTCVGQTKTFQGYDWATPSLQLSKVARLLEAVPEGMLYMR